MYGNATITNGGSGQPAATAWQNERQRHGEFVLPMRLLARLSGNECEKHYEKRLAMPL